MRVNYFYPSHDPAIVSPSSVSLLLPFVLPLACLRCARSDLYIWVPDAEIHVGPHPFSLTLMLLLTYFPFVVISFPAVTRTRIR